MAPKAAKTVEQQHFVIPELKTGLIDIRLEGDTPLISHAWDAKAIKMIQDKQGGAARLKKGPREPIAEYEASLYKYPGGGYGYPARAFKAAAVNACRMVDGIAMTEARIAFHVMGENETANQLVKIDGEPNMRTDMVRLETGVADVRYRGEFKTWAVTLKVRYNANMFTPAQIYNLFNNAGWVGVGDDRPSSPKSKSGTHGTFHVVTGEQ